MTPLMFVSALMQYNSGINAVSTNARFRWEYRPGSELFVVYNEERNTLTRSFPVAQQPRVHRENQSTVPSLAPADAARASPLAACPRAQPRRPITAG